MDAFWESYGDLPYTELTPHRTELGFWISDYQRSTQKVPLNEELFAEFVDKTIEHALLSKLIHKKMLESVFPCPGCGVLCENNQDKCHQCGREFKKE